MPGSDHGPSIKNPATPCLEWTRARSSAGYGQTSWNGKVWYTHRKAWVDAFGPIPDGLMILHHCDNPPCYRLDHLFLGTQKDNMADARRKGRFPRRTLTRERALAMNEILREKGVKVGRRGIVDEDMLQRAREMRLLGTPYHVIGRELGVSWGTARRYLLGLIDAVPR